MAKQKILRMITLDQSIRASADAWDGEDGDEIKQDKAIGLSGGPHFRLTYPTPMHAIGDGWRLMGPPVPIKNWAPGIDGWEWWFEK